MRLLPAALIAVALAGCGAGEDAADGTEPREAAPEGPAISLEVTVWPTGRANGPRHVTTLECDPVGGNHPAPEESCRTLTANPGLLEPVPEDVMCTQQFGGPEQARVRGAYRGRELDLRYSRANGCEISRWDRLAPLFKVVV